MPYRNPFAEFMGAGVRVAIIDSGVHPTHPHVGEIAGGISFSSDGESPIFLDFIGHGTAVAGAIREKAPSAALYCLKVFDRSLRTNAETILRAIDWAIDHEMHVINLSLGTQNSAHWESFEQAALRAAARNIALVAALELNGQETLPGCLPQVIAAEVDWKCPRDSMGYRILEERFLFLASGYPREIPGVPPARNLSGISFAVANITGFVARAREAFPSVAIHELMFLLADAAEEK